MNLSKQNSGFTLIELLVVIAIIGLLSAIVLASLATAKAKGTDAAIEEDMHQLQVIAEEEYDATNNYNPLQLGGWIPGNSSAGGPGLTSCAAAFNADTYALQAQTVCNAIIALSNPASTFGDPGPGLELFAGNIGGNSQKYSFMAWLPGTNEYLCIGNDGTSMQNSSNPWNSLGCFGNP